MMIVKSLSYSFQNIFILFYLYDDPNPWETIYDAIKWSIIILLTYKQF